MRFLLSCSLFSLALAASRTSPPSGALEVGSGAQYTKVQDAVNALSTSSTTAQSIFINPGTYDEQVSIPELKSLLTIYGYTEDTSSYTGNQVTITHGLSQENTGGNNDGTATVRAESANFKMYNINMVNTYGKGSQALALSANAGNQGYYGCQFQGYQDTVLTETGTQLFAKCLIVGVTDFIFGQHAQTWFDQCDIRVLSASLGYITANGRSSDSDPSYFVINRGTVAAADGNSVTEGAFYLGRPWKEYARVTFQRVDLSAVINAAGWRIWNEGDENTEHVLFGEYGNTGTGASGTRASFSTTLSSPVSVSSILGSEWSSAEYVDTSYMYGDA